MAGLHVTIHSHDMDSVLKKIARLASESETEMAEQAKSDTNDYVPMSGSPAGIANRAQVVGNMIVYPGPYSRYLYYGKLYVDPVTGSAWASEGATKVKAEPEKDLHFSTAHHGNAQAHWFEASKAQNLNKWIRVAAEAVSKFDGK